MRFDRHRPSYSPADRRHTIVCQVLFLVAFLLVNDWRTSDGQEPAPPADVTEREELGSVARTGKETDTTPAGPAEAADLEQARRRAFSTGVVMLGGILICGVGLIAIVLLWGNRTRRIARQALPKVAPRDELWYLKNRVESELERPDDRDKDDDSTAETRV